MVLKTKHKIFTIQEANNSITSWRDQGMQIVFTNGCFDILHLGHIDYLEKARAKGDKLVVGLNTDRSISALKGPQRPINTEYARARILAALEFVDGVVLFDEDTPELLIQTLSPDILIKGNDYKVGNIVGAEFVLKKGGRVETIELVSGYSTTDILNKIKNL